MLGHRENGDCKYFCLWSNGKVTLTDERKLDDDDPVLKAYRFPGTPFVGHKPVNLGYAVYTHADGFDVLPSVSSGGRAPFIVVMPFFRKHGNGPRIEIRQAVTVERVKNYYRLCGLHTELVPLLDSTALLVFHNLKFHN